MNQKLGTETTWRILTRMDNLSSFRICSFNLRGFAKNDPQLQLEKLMTAVRSHDLIGLLDTRINQEDVDVLIKNNKQTFEDFHDPILIPSITRGIMVLLRKSSPFKMDKTEVVTQNCLAVKLKSDLTPEERDQFRELAFRLRAMHLEVISLPLVSVGRERYTPPTRFQRTLGGDR